MVFLLSLLPLDKSAIRCCSNISISKMGGNCYTVTSTTFHTYLDVCYCRALSVSARENVVFLHEAEIVFSALYFMANVTSTAVGTVRIDSVRNMQIIKMQPQAFQSSF